jgi:hypothetical protein
LFKYLALRPLNFIGSDPSELPEPTGVFDPETGRIILNFQRSNHYLLMGRPDGLIHPASFAGRTLHVDGKKMTISLLNEEVAATAFDLVSALDATEAVIKVFPQLRPWLMEGSTQYRGSYKMKLPQPIR